MFFWVWMGIWIIVIIMFVVVFDFSVFVWYIMRFIEESFVCLIVIIFIYEVIKKVIGIIKKYFVNFNLEYEYFFNCICMLFIDNFIYFNVMNLMMVVGLIYVV